MSSNSKYVSNVTQTMFPFNISELDHYLLKISILRNALNIIKR